MARDLRFYTDEHIARAVIRGLRLRGIDVLTCQDAELRTASDEEHLQFAVAEGRVVITQDADFLRLHAEGVPHCGIVYAPQTTSVSEIVRALLLIYEVLSAADMDGHVEFL